MLHDSDADDMPLGVIIPPPDTDDDDDSRSLSSSGGDDILVGVVCDPDASKSRRDEDDDDLIFGSCVVTNNDLRTNQQCVPVSSPNSLSSVVAPTDSSTAITSKKKDKMKGSLTLNGAGSGGSEQQQQKKRPRSTTNTKKDKAAVSTEGKTTTTKTNTTTTKAPVASSSSAAAAASSKKGVKLTEDEVRMMVLKWFNSQNKPAVAVGIRAALGSSMSQALIQKCIDSLAEEGILISKDFKKTKVYFLPQATPSTTSTGGDGGGGTTVSMDGLKSAVEELKRRNDALTKDTLTLQSAIASTSAAKSTMELREATQQLEAQNAVMLQKIQEKKRQQRQQQQNQQHGSVAAVTPQMMQDAADTYFTYRTEWFRRRGLMNFAMEAYCGDRKLEVAFQEMDMAGDTADDLKAAQFAVPKRYIRRNQNTSVSATAAAVLPGGGGVGPISRGGAVGQVGTQQQHRTPGSGAAAVAGKKIVFLPRKKK